LIARVAPSSTQAAHFSAEPGRGVDRRAERLGKLDRRHADAARAAMDEEALARFEPAAQKDILPHGEERFRQRGRLHRVEALGEGQRGAFVGYAVLRIAAAGHQRGDAVAHLEARGARPRLDHLARDFQARNVGRAGGRRIIAPALQHVRPVDARRRHADQQLALPRTRHAAAFGLENLRAAAFSRDGNRRHFIRQGHFGLLLRVFHHLLTRRRIMPQECRRARRVLR
jgi:hypothetical protein